MSTNELAIPFAGPGEFLAAGILLPVVGIIVVALRFWIRTSQKSKAGLDDYAIFLALFCVIGMGACLIAGVAKHSIGYATPTVANPSAETELFEIGPEQRTVELLDWIIWLLMIPVNGLIKLSALFLYRRIFVVNTWSTFDIISKVFLVICSMWTVAFFFATLFGCGKHFDYPWRPLYYVGSCETNMRLDVLMVSDLLTDVFVWLLPIIPVYKLKMKPSQKTAVIGIFLLAAVSLAAAIVRLLIQFEISDGGYAAHTDVNLTLSNLLYWSMIESGLALIAACLPTLRYIVARSSISSVISSVRSAIRLDSLLSRGSPSSRAVNNTDYYEISVATKVSQTSVHNVNSKDAPEIPLILMNPGQAHIKDTWNRTYSEAYAA